MQHPPGPQSSTAAPDSLRLVPSGSSRAGSHLSPQNETEFGSEEK